MTSALNGMEKVMSMFDMSLVFEIYMLHLDLGVVSSRKECNQRSKRKACYVRYASYSDGIDTLG